MDGVVSVFRSRMLQLHTTRSWNFLGLTLPSSETIAIQLAYGDDIVVGIFDTGIWPESDSFQEEPGTGCIPKTWQGKCVSGDKFDPKTACNKKLIGARYYLKGIEQEHGQLDKFSTEYRSARDHDGHGTHTASTAVGSVVRNASFFNFGLGIARGGAPKARLAVYKICWDTDSGGTCSEADIMAAFDDALRDGVNVISASFGRSPPLLPFFASASDIGSFHAMEKGVSVVFSAGNDGPIPSLVSNVSPWSICVAASSIDRTFPTQIVIDSSLSFMGEGFSIKQIKAILADSSDYFVNGICKPENWNGTLATGMVILCLSTVGSVSSGEAGFAAYITNASALIFVEPLNQLVPEVDIIPTIHIDIIQGTKLYHYLVLSSKPPVVQIAASRTLIKKSLAPFVAQFSSRGPSSLSPDILKPDISAPGINILAAWPPNISPTSFNIDGRSVYWNFLSGTSMSCPHVSGVVALLKSAHPQWSPAAIKSALMTTAYTHDNTGDSILFGGITKTADPFDIGAGHIDPLRAMDPGLVYDMKIIDYIQFLCNIGYSEDKIKIITGTKTFASCRKGFASISNENLNYPSITISNLRSTMTIKRTVTNVGKMKTTFYFAKIVKPDGVEVVIWPRILAFSWLHREVSYYVTFIPMKKSQGRFDFGEIIWSDGSHSVRIPLVVLVNTLGSTITTVGNGSSSDYSII